ncbi:MAG: alkaline phosphatase D family protein [Sporichthyaceae bacterium]
MAPTRRNFVRSASLVGVAVAAPTGWRVLTESTVALPAAAAAALPEIPNTAPIDRIAAPSRRIAPPFALGVASGEPSAAGVVLWTRLAPRPLETDGHGGMPDRDVDVEWQMASDPDFRSIVRSGRETATRRDAHSVHVEVAGLEPAREYWYRFRAEGHLSGIGRTRTAPAAGARDAIEFAVASCAFWEQGHFTVYRHIAEDRPDLVLHLGDYLYEYEPRFKPPASGIVREHLGGRCTTLAQFRRRHAQYRGDVDLQAAHAAAPWLVIPDDHEVADNWNSSNAKDVTDPRTFAALRAAAFQAYWEHMPLRPGARPGRAGLPIFRTVPWGRTATFHMLDTRQYRDRQGCQPKSKAACVADLPSTRTMLGAAQERWLSDGLAASGATWQFLAQQVMFASTPRAVDSAGRALAEPYVNTDCWDGYPGAQRRLLDSAKAADVRNLVVLTGDAHVHWAAEIHPGGTVSSDGPVAVELVTSAITTGGDLIPQQPWVREALKSQPHLKYWDGRRGWIKCRADAERLRADFQVVEKVSTPGARAFTDASFEVLDGRPGLRRR